MVDGRQPVCKVQDMIRIFPASIHIASAKIYRFRDISALMNRICVFMQQS